MIKPAIKVNGKVFTGNNHHEAISKAKKAGFKVLFKDREKIGKFITPKGLLTRKQTKKAYGISHSHQL